MKTAPNPGHPPSPTAAEPLHPSAPPVNLLYVTYLAAAAALGGFLFGFDSAVINGAIGGVQRAFGSTSLATGFAVASILLGSALGAFVAGRQADRFGRRPIMLVAALLFFVSAIWSGVAGREWSFTWARFVGGLGVGAASVVCPAYIAEIAPARMRGRLAALQQLGIVVGIFLALLCDDLLARAAGGVSAPWWAGYEAWRWMLIVEALPALVFGLAMLTVPESPRFLVAQNREQQALRSLRRIEPSTPEAVIDEIRRTAQHDRAPRLADLKGPRGKVLPIVWVGVALSVLQQFVGINSIFYYGSVLWESVGFSTADSLAINVVTGFVNIVSTLVAMAFVDRAGRRPLLLWGSVGMVVTLGVLALTFGTGAVGDAGQIVLSTRASIVALLAANLYVFAFGLSWGPCVWILLGEMFPNSIRGTAMAVAVFAQWMANWLVTVSFPSLVEALGATAPYLIYCSFAALSWFIVRRYVPETRGKKLEAMSTATAG